MSLRFGSGWLVIYFLICSCTFICSAPQLRARDYTTFNLLPLRGRAALIVEVTRPRGRPASRCCVGAFQNSKGLKCVERREAGRGLEHPKPSSHSGPIVGKPEVTMFGCLIFEEFDFGGAGEQAGGGAAFDEFPDGSVAFFTVAARPFVHVHAY